MTRISVELVPRDLAIFTQELQDIKQSLSSNVDFIMFLIY